MHIQLLEHCIPVLGSYLHALGRQVCTGSLSCCNPLHMNAACDTTLKKEGKHLRACKAPTQHLSKPLQPQPPQPRWLIPQNPKKLATLATKVPVTQWIPQ